MYFKRCGLNKEIVPNDRYGYLFTTSDELHEVMVRIFNTEREATTNSILPINIHKEVLNYTKAPFGNLVYNDAIRTRNHFPRPFILPFPASDKWHDMMASLEFTEVFVDTPLSVAKEWDVKAFV